MIYKGSSGLKAYVGSTGVDKMYLGDVLVYSSAPPVLPDYLCFTALESGTFTFTIGSYVNTTSLQYVEYSTDEGKTWVKTSNVASTTVTVTTPTIQTGEKVLWRGKGNRLSQSNSGTNERCCVFSSTCDFNIGGILMSLLMVSDIAEDTQMAYTYSFSRLFYGNTHVVDASELILPPNTLGNGLDYFFTNCTSLAKAPKTLPSTMDNYGCRQFFRGCTSLVDSPVLPAATLTTGSYYQMFYGCTALRRVMCLATDRSATNCMYQWLANTTNTSACIFVKHIDATWTTTGNSAVPTNWTVIYYNPTTDKYYLSDKTTECDDHGNVV